MKKTPGLIVDTQKSPKPLLEKVVKEFVRLKFIIDTMAFGESKFMVYIRVYIRLLYGLLLKVVIFKGVCKLKDNENFRELNMRFIKTIV